MSNKTRISVFILGLVCLYLTSCNSPAGPVQPARGEPGKFLGGKITLTVTGKVTDAVTSLPISGAKVTLSVHHNYFLSKSSQFGLTLEAEDDGSTNQAGQYSVNCDLFKNRTYYYNLKAEARGYINKYHSWPEGKLWEKFEKNTTHKVDLQLEPES